MTAEYFQFHKKNAETGASSFTQRPLVRAINPQRVSWFLLMSIFYKHLHKYGVLFLKNRVFNQTFSKTGRGAARQAELYQICRHVNKTRAPTHVDVLGPIPILGNKKRTDTSAN